MCRFILYNAFTYIKMDIIQIDQEIDQGKKIPHSNVLDNKYRCTYYPKKNLNMISGKLRL